MNKTLIVGGAGYLGGALTDILVERNIAFTVYDSLLYEESYRKPINFVYGDVRDTDKLKNYIDQHSTIVWLAAIVGDGACSLNPEITIDVNTNSLKRAMPFIAEKPIIFTSTCSVYGAQQNVILDETSPFNPLSLYATSKLDTEKILEPFNATVFRLGTLFGVGDNFSRIRFDLVVNTLTWKAFQNNKLTIFGGQQFRPLLHVKDAAAAIANQITNFKKGTYNLHRQNVCLMDLAYQMRCHFEGLEIETVDMKFEDSRNYQVTSKKAKEEIQFKPATTIDKGIDEIKTLLEAKRINLNGNPRYSNVEFLKINNGRHK